MELITPSVNDIPALKRLWIECFGDSVEYTDYIFTRLILNHPENIYAMTQGDAIPAMLFVADFQLVLGEVTASGAYIFGVGTAVNWRGRGLSTLLLEKAHKALADRGYALSILLPADMGLRGFYEKRGYEPFSKIRSCILTGESIPKVPPCPAEPVGLETLYNLRESYFSGSGAYVRWPVEYLRYVGSEFTAFGGHILRLNFGDRQGYCSLQRFNNSVFVKELACLPEDFGSVARTLYEKYSAADYRFSLREDFFSGYPYTDLPYAMIKWYDKKRREISNYGFHPPYISYTLD